MTHLSSCHVDPSFSSSLPLSTSTQRLRPGEEPDVAEQLRPFICVNIYLIIHGYIPDFYMHMDIDFHIYVSIFIFIHSYSCLIVMFRVISVSRSVSIFRSIFMFAYVNVYTHVSNKLIYMYTSKCTYVHMYIYIYTCV